MLAGAWYPLLLLRESYFTDDKIKQGKERGNFGLRILVRVN
jgi:hypothetical protein